eukprot:Seg1879.2 transcript_id=Seg1879.2/GoldUCD/mRNA.D3Y31 product="PHD finger protein 10" protein_id=Seg1879.2/GoldUCD/D3Y31
MSVEQQSGKLVEYQWPASKDGDFFMLQDQVSSFLGTTAFQLKFPGVSRRLVSKEERKFLCDKGLVTESQNSKELTTLKTDDVVDLMADKYPQKYQDYLQFVHERERRKIIDDQNAQMIVKNTGKTASYVKKAIKDASEYNLHLNQDRKDERLAYFDMQTQIIQVPRKTQQIISPEKRKRNRYPVALMPGQFQDYFKIYSPDELRSLPLSSVMTQWSTGGLDSVDDKDENANNSDSSDSQSSSDEEGNSTDDDAASDADAPPLKKALRSRDNVGNAKHRNKVSGIQNDSFCGICLKGAETNKKGIPEDLVNCSFCENSGHPSCLDMNRQLVLVIKTYPWQCMECKTCTLCSNPHDEEHMMFCDNCDRGYHSYCVGLKNIPDGRWVCEKCGKCASCLSRQPCPDGTPGKWREEFKRSREGGDAEFLQFHCHKCSKLFRAGNFCPVCLKVYRSDEKDLPMVCCDCCDRWIHTDCDDIDDQRYQELSKDSSAQYKCVICRGEKEERMDAFHKKHRGK